LFEKIGKKQDVNIFIFYDKQINSAFSEIWYDH